MKSWMNEEPQYLPYILAEEDRVALALQIIRHVDCERFDRAHCSGWHGGVAVPVDSIERVRANANAIEAVKRMERAAADLSIGRSAVDRARENPVFRGSEAAIEGLYDWAVQQVEKRRQAVRDLQTARDLAFAEKVAAVSKLEVVRVVGRPSTSASARRDHAPRCGCYACRGRSE